MSNLSDLARKLSPKEMEKLKEKSAQQIGKIITSDMTRVHSAINDLGLENKVNWPKSLMFSAEQSASQDYSYLPAPGKSNFR